MGPRLRLAAVVVLMALLSVAAFSYMWLEVAGSQMSGHGIAALVLCIVLTILIYVPLMWLMSVSARNGHDEDVAYFVPEPRSPMQPAETPPAEPEPARLRLVVGGAPCGPEEPGR